MRLLVSLERISLWTFLSPFVLLLSGLFVVPICSAFLEKTAYAEIIFNKINP